MPRSEKVSEGARGASNATADARNSVESILSLTDEEFLHRFQSLSEDDIKKLVPLLRVLFSMLAIQK